MDQIKDMMVFGDLKVINGQIECTYQDNTAKGKLYFNLTPSIQPSNDMIAVALSTLCGRDRYISITFDFPVSEPCVQRIRDFCNSEILVPIYAAPPIAVRRHASALSFSGGFDSLAAKYLMPDDTVLVSLDFGGRFAREGIFFNRFNPYVVETNVLETHLRRNSWSFMGIAAILFSEYLNIKYHTFGGIFESSATNLSKNPPAAKNMTFPPFSAAGMQNVPYVIGITEIGTAKILLNYAKDIMLDSLDSLAGKGENKLYRKQLISQLAAERSGVELDIGELDTPNNRWDSFGKSIADDFLSFYFMKYRGENSLLKLYQTIPDEIEQLASSRPLTFYERLNPNFLENFPQAMLPGLMSKAASVGLIPYTAQDWDDLEAVASVLSRYYKL